MGWKKVKHFLLPETDHVQRARAILHKGNDVYQMMKVVGEEGTPNDDFVLYLKSDYLDATYLQQDAYDKIDGATGAERQKHVFSVFIGILETDMKFADKSAARRFFHELTQMTRDWNRIEMGTSEFKDLETRILKSVSEVSANA